MSEYSIEVFQRVTTLRGEVKIVPLFAIKPTTANASPSESRRRVRSLDLQQPPRNGG